MGEAKLTARVAAVAEAALTKAGVVSPLDVLAGLGWVHGRQIDEWRQGRRAVLEQALSVRPAKVAVALHALRGWAEGRGLQAVETEYVAATRDRRPLRFSADGDDLAFRTHWVSPDLSEARRQRLTKVPDLVVVVALKEWTCGDCHGTGDLLVYDGDRPTCLTCADMDHLVLLPRGDAALTRRAKKASGLSAVVVRFNRSRRRYERQGVLVEETALEQAEEQCLADEDVRARRRERDRERRAGEDLEFQARMAAEIVRLFPRCPAGRAEAIACHAGTRGSGRVGRTAAGRALDPHAVRGAVIASVRHEDTPYDTLLMSGVPRDTARDQIRQAVDRVLAAWSP